VNNKIEFINLFKDSMLGLLGMFIGLILLNESISSKTALKYAAFAIVVGPITRIIINQYPTQNDLNHVIVVVSGLFGFFIFKGLMVMVIRFSKNPIKTIKDIKTQVKK
jgi:hypothetical protein